MTENKNRLPAMLETSYWVVYLNFDQRFLGRSVIVLKRSVGDLAGVTEEEFLDLRKIIQTMENALRGAFDATMFNWACLMNNAYQEENPNPQVHFHVWPRYRNPVTFEGQIFTDENFGHYIPGREVSQPSVLSEDTFIKIRAAIVARMELS